MSEPIAEVKVVPDLTGFAAKLEAELTGAVRAAVRGANVGVGATSSGPAAVAAARATRNLNTALADQQRVISASAIQTERFSRGIAATALSQVGLRGATLAATSAFLAGAAAVTAFSKAVGLAVSFDRQLSVFAATTGATATQLEKVRTSALALGKDLTLPGVSATDAAEAMTELAKAGLSVEDAIAGARGVLQLGTAANISFAEATTLAANAINAFGLAGRDATHVADVLANAANAAQGSIVDIGIAFQQAAAVGHQVGLSFEDTAGFLTSLAKAGLTSSDAGTSLRTALIRLINPSKKASEIFKSLGIAIRDANGNLRPEFFVNLGDALAGMSKKQRDATLAIIGGQDAVRALSILTKQSVQDLLAQRAQLEQQGTAAKLAASRMTGLAGAAANFQNTIENIAVGVGEKATPSLVSLTNALTGLTSGIANSPLVTGTLASAAQATGEAFHGLGVVLTTLGPVLGTAAAALNTVFSTIGGTNIVVAIGSFLLLNRTITAFGVEAKGAALGLKLLLAEMETSIALGGTLRATLQVGAAGLAAFATSATGVTLALAAITAGLFFYFTRESEAERLNRHLKESTDDLAASLRNQKDAQDSLNATQRAAQSDVLEVQAARLAATQARSALANSNAGAGSFERLQLENRLAFALQDVDFAERRLVEDRKAVRQATALAANADEQRRLAALKQADALTALVDKEQDAFKELQNLHNLGLVGLNFVNRGTLAAIDELNKSLGEAAQKQRALQTPEGLDIAQRLESLQKLLARVNNVPTVVRLLFNAKDVDTGLKQVLANLKATGQEGAAAFTQALILGFDPQVLLDPLAEMFAKIAAAAGDAGAATAKNFASGFTFTLKQLLGQAAGFGRQALFADIAGNVQGQLAALEQQEAVLRRGLSRARTSGNAAAQEKFGQQLLANLNEQDSIRSQIASEAKKRADARQKKIDDAQKARDKEDQSFLALLGLRQGRFDIRQIRVQSTKGLADDIKFEEDFQAFLRRQIKAAQQSIHNVLLRQQTVQQLIQALRRSQASEKELEDQRRATIKQAIIDRRDAREESLNLDIQTAQAKENQRQELKAHQALLNFLIARQKHTERGSLEWKRLQVKIEEERKAIRDLRKAQKDRRDEAKSLAFEFLQTQSGFAGSILSNLLPAGSVAGSVGGGAISTGTSVAVPPAGFATAVHQRPVQVPSANFAQAVHARGATAGQMGSLIDIERQILLVLRKLAGQNTHPETVNQRVLSKNDLDTAWGV